MKILMVCLGNICRSPLAEGLMREALGESVKMHEVDSAGMISYHAGEPPDPRSMAVARSNGIDISGQRARRMTPADLDRFDLILAMDMDVYRDILSLADSEAHRGKVHPFLEYAGYPPGQIVPDPYYGGTGDFNAVYRLIADACNRIAEGMRGMAPPHRSSV